MLDLQSGLAVVLGDSGGNHYVHAPRGIHAQQNNVGDWQWMIQDGLGSVRSVIDSAEILESRLYEPYGGVFGTSGTIQTGYGFTGEQYDASTDLLYLRARYYAPNLGVFTALDPFEGGAQRPMSLNGYSWVEGNVVNAIDPSGMIYETPINWGVCSVQVIPSINDISNLIWTITSNYPIRCIQRGSDRNGNLISSCDAQNMDSINLTQHEQILLNLLSALSIIESKLATVGKSLNTLVTDERKISLFLDYTIGGGFQGIVSMDDTVTYRMRLGNNMISEYIAHEWGHALDRNANRAYSNSLAMPGQGVYIQTHPPTQATIRSVGQTMRRTIILGSNTGCAPYNDGGELDIGGTLIPNNKYLLSGSSPKSPGLYQRCLIGYGDLANDVTTGDPSSRFPSEDPKLEDWADMFMNWVFDGQPSSSGAGFDKADHVFARGARRAWMNRYLS